MMRLKQTDPLFTKHPYNAIQTDGCFFRSLLHCSEFFTGKVLSADEIKLAFHYSLPDFMEDHRHPKKDRCYIMAGGHAQIIRIGFYILGERNVTITYRYRRDLNTDTYIIGKRSDFMRCNFWIAKCKMPAFNHFYVSNLRGSLLWNPGQSYSNELLSLRGFRIQIHRP